MSKSRAPERHTLTLLIQLFGREVLDLLARAGFDDEAAIARVGPERLAAASGISLPVAQRIVTVVEEARGSSAGPLVATDAAPIPSPREPGRRKAPPRRAAIKKQAAPIESPPAPAIPDQNDPFVDDVALVAWMGFTSQTPVGGRLSFSVADRILDPVRPGTDTPQAAPEAPCVPASTGSVTTAQRDDAIGESGPDATSPVTLPGSFWSFGSPAGSRGAPGAPVNAPPGKDRHDH
jgi:hypothetical protein